MKKSFIAFLIFLTGLLCAGSSFQKDESDPIWTAYLAATPPVTAESDPVWTAYLAATPPVTVESDPVWTAYLAATPPVTVEADPVFAGLAGISDSTSYWLCTAADCSTSCQVTIASGVITACT